MKLKFYGKDRYEELIAEINDFDEITDIVKEYLDKNNIKSNYMRTWIHNDKLWIDYGSHYHFFVVELEGKKIE